MPSTTVPSFEAESAPPPAALGDDLRLRQYFESMRELTLAVAALAECDELTQKRLFIEVDGLIERQLPEIVDLAPPIMTVLASSPDWRERRWAMQMLVKIARLVPAMAGTFVPGYLAHIESPAAIERDLDDLTFQPSRERLATEFGYGNALTVAIELPIPVGEHLQDVALEGLDQLSMIVPDFAVDAFSVLEALSDRPTKAGARAAALLARLRLGDRMRRLEITEEFLLALRAPYVIAVARNKKFHLGHCRFAKAAIGKDAYLFLHPQEATEFGFVPCQACR